MVYKVILDTDIGTDADDALALAILLGSNKVELLGITTVYGDTKLRAQIALKLCKTAGRNIPTYVGATNTLNGENAWVTGNEGSNFVGLEMFHPNLKKANRYLVEEVSNFANQIDIIAIGPLTNIATTITNSEIFASKIKNLWIMGGNFSTEKIEHNIKSDIDAAKIVFNSNIQICVLDLPSAQLTLLNKKEIELIKQSGRLGNELYYEIKNWIEPRNQDWTIPHDPILTLSLIHPEFFKFSELGFVSIDDEGRTLWTEDSKGNVRKITPIEPSLAVAKMIELIGSLN